MPSMHATRRVLSETFLIAAALDDSHGPNDSVASNRSQPSSDSVNSAQVQPSDPPRKVIAVSRNGAISANDTMSATDENRSTSAAVCPAATSRALETPSQPAATSAMAMA